MAQMRWGVRRPAAAVLLMLTVLCVAGCHSTFGGEDAEAGAASVATVGSMASSGTDPYLPLAQERLDGARSADLLESREASCAAFDASAERQTWTELLAALTDSGLSPEDAGYLLALQVRTGCPEHVDLLP